MRRKTLWNMVYASSLAAALMMNSAGIVYAAEGETESEAQTQTVSQQETEILLSDDGILIDGEEISDDSQDAVYAGAEIIYYHEGQDATYGAGDEEDAHSAEEAAEHTVVTITQPGTYRVSGSLSKGQIAIDLGEDSREDESAVVTLILDQADITCTVAPAIVVYNAYECGSHDTEDATKEVDTGSAGFHLVIADGSENTVNGSYVAKIYREGTTQEEVDAGEAKKAWKFDAAIDSLISMEIDGEESGDGKLTVTSDNEGIETSLHLTINGGQITVNSSDDAINTNEDGVSVLTVNGGHVVCNAGGGQEGDGMDSNGWIVINGGIVIASANATSQDSGVDSDLGVYINGGTVLASGNMYDEVAEDSGQTFAVLSFSEKVESGSILLLKNSDDEPVAAFTMPNDFQTIVYSSELLEDGDYTLYEVSAVTGELDGGLYTEITEVQGEEQLQYSSSSMMGAGGGMGGPGGDQMQPGEQPEMPENGEQGEQPEMPENGEPGEQPEMPENGEQGERPEMPENGEQGEQPEMPENGEQGEQPEMPENGEQGELPEMPENGGQGEQPQMPENGEQGEQPEMPDEMGEGMGAEAESSSVFTISGIQNIFAQITKA